MDQKKLRTRSIVITKSGKRVTRREKKGLSKHFPYRNLKQKWWKQTSFKEIWGPIFWGVFLCTSSCTTKHVNSLYTKVDVKMAPTKRYKIWFWPKQTDINLIWKKRPQITNAYALCGRTHRHPLVERLVHGITTFHHVIRHQQLMFDDILL